MDTYFDLEFIPPLFLGKIYPGFPSKTISPLIWIPSGGGHFPSSRETLDMDLLNRMITSLITVIGWAMSVWFGTSHFGLKKPNEDSMQELLRCPKSLEHLQVVSSQESENEVKSE